MARDYTNFVGLTRERTPVGPHWKFYEAPHAFGGSGFNTFDGDLQLLDLATSLVSPPTHYTCPTASCPVHGGHALSVVDDLAAAQHISRGGLYPSETVTERAALSPTPEFVQLRIADCNFAIERGTEGCGVSGNCGPFASSSISYDMFLDFGYFWWDDPYDSTSAFQTRQTRSFDGNIADTLLQGYIWRTPDADSYTGHPSNEASDTLIPWADFIASPYVELHASMSAHFVTWVGARFLVDLWYSTGTVSTTAGLTCFIGSA